jgi:uncharacterized cupredoxin-like copper-binding protein
MKTKIILAAIGLTLAQFSFAHSEQHAKKPNQQANFIQEEWGIGANKKEVNRTIVIKMTDKMRFLPEKIDVRMGETIRFEVKNDGKVMHEMVIGTKPILDKHAELMLKNPNMEHDEPYMAHVSPGKTGEIIWKFNRKGNFDFACLMAGHYQAGMVGKIEVK